MRNIDFFLLTFAAFTEPDPIPWYKQTAVAGTATYIIIIDLNGVTNLS